MSERICFIHIGAPKTGTTYLQRSLCDNRGQLLDKGILYPDVSLRGYGHHDIAFLLSGGYPDWATPQMRTLDDLGDQLGAMVRASPQHVLLSSENFYLFPAPERLRQFLDQTGIAAVCRVVILVYIRRQDEAHASWYNQTIKAQGYTHDLDDCIEDFFDLWDYRKQLDAWADVFGQENLRVRPYEHDQFHEGNLLLDLLFQMNVDPQGIAIPAERINAGLNRDALEFQRLINALPLSHQDKRKFHRELIDLSEKAARTGIFDESPLMPEQQKKAIMARYAVGNTEVAKKYLAGRSLFEASARDPSEDRVYGGLTLDAAVRLMGWLFIRQQS